MDETRNSIRDPTEVQNVLAKYLELFSSHSNFFKFYISQNGVLEWFGKTIKGNQKIHDYLRYEVCSQFDHLFFENAAVCEPIECKSSHMETKTLSSEIDTKAEKKLNDSSFTAETTSLTDELSIYIDVARATEERCESRTPPTSAKRFKPDFDLNQSIQPPMLNIEDYFIKKNSNVKPNTSRSMQSCFETPASTTISNNTSLSKVKYSELKYIETTGILRSCIQPEHKGFRNSCTLNANGSWDRETKIQISYRTRLDDNDVQFALIIYKNLYPYSAVSRRNLMTEFDEVATQKRLNEENKIKSTVQKEKRKIGRRLRLF